MHHLFKRLIIRRWRKNFAALEPTSFVETRGKSGEWTRPWKGSQQLWALFLGSKNTWQLTTYKPKKRTPPKKSKNNCFFFFFGGGGAPPKKHNVKHNCPNKREIEPKTLEFFEFLVWWGIAPSKLNIHTLDWGKPASFLETKQTYTTFSQSENLKTAEYMQKLNDIEMHIYIYV